jgi:hypothetical protein
LKQQKGAAVYPYFTPVLFSENSGEQVNIDTFKGEAILTQYFLLVV